MSEKLLKALMQLFAIVANVDDGSNASRSVVQQFLKQRLNQELVDVYLSYYDEYLEAHHKISRKKEGQRKKTALNSVKVLRICTQINEELSQAQKIFVLIRLLEYVYVGREATPQEVEFIDTVSDAFNISSEEHNNIREFITSEINALPDNTNILIANPTGEVSGRENTKSLKAETLTGSLAFLGIESVGMYLLRYSGEAELYLNGQIIDHLRTYIFKQGSSIRSAKVSPIYYSDVISKFLSDKTESRIVFNVDDITYRFKGGTLGLNNLTFSEESGKLIGIMGASGSGKSTLLNILNGNYTPTTGHVTINGIDIHRAKDDASGMIGYISQDDLLIEELTVFQNLYTNAKLCFDGYSEERLTEMVNELLKALGLYERKDLKVGNPLDKKISGGQRKRLNIALELIREPSVLFVDEPTSGLSSRDSENIMDLLKELALKGKLIFVVIHQPSSDIFKMFDKLLIMDTGGFPIYYANPVDAVIYFKTEVNHINQDESECQKCGNVNPEQIFNIIESPVIDEYGNITGNRKISPKEWYATHSAGDTSSINPETPPLPKINFKIPNRLKQFQVFLWRDVLSKISNQQYLMINLLEAPILALILSYFLRFFSISESGEEEFIFYQNDNLPAFMFISVIVALFIGLTVSAEEIFKDRRIRKRESFLDLSKLSYLCSKVVIMFTLSAVQTFTFVVLGNLILGIKGMYLDYWLILFSTACFANMLGLNISSSFNSAVTIYIVIPFLLIPQILFSGVIVKFDKLNPTVTSQTIVPVIGEIMASRWAFEALAVNQFKENDYEKQFFSYNQEMSTANFQKNFWGPAIKSKLGSIERHMDEPEKKKELANDLALVRNEVAKQLVNLPYVQFEGLETFTPEAISKEKIQALRNYLDKVNKYFIRQYNSNSNLKDSVIGAYQSSPEGKEAFNQLRNDYENESLTDLVTNKAEFNQIAEFEGDLIQRADPVYLNSKGVRSHFYAPNKRAFGRLYSTFSYNICVLWVMSLILGITLYFDFFKRMMDWLGSLSELFSGLGKK